MFAAAIKDLESSKGVFSEDMKNRILAFKPVLNFGKSELQKVESAKFTAFLASIGSSLKKGEDAEQELPETDIDSTSDSESEAPERLWAFPMELSKVVGDLSRIPSTEFAAEVRNKLRVPSSEFCDDGGTFDVILDIAYYALWMHYLNSTSADLREADFQNVLVQVLQILAILVVSSLGREDLKVEVRDATGKPRLVCVDGNGVLTKPRKGKTDILIFINSFPRFLLELKPKIHLKQQLHQMLACVSAVEHAVLINAARDIHPFGLLMSPGVLVLAQKAPNHEAVVFNTCSFAEGWSANVKRVGGLLKLCCEGPANAGAPGANDSAADGGGGEDGGDEKKGFGDDDSEVELSFQRATPTPRKTRSGKKFGGSSAGKLSFSLTASGQSGKENEDMSTQEYQDYMRKCRQQRAEVLARRSGERVRSPFASLLLS